ncbi:hypothetical protein EVAR_97530_1 [Eumeta japonica]|uniref:Uncharacterized protein n=1 Tax=Eumeta variegata TaxID=151549 RepID=A0A4C1WMI0_EUMVA|nr:hypothetical protein EVAR_97530_1 [Eumeta japonica]
MTCALTCVPIRVVLSLRSTSGTFGALIAAVQTVGRHNSHDNSGARGGLNAFIHHGAYRTPPAPAGRHPRAADEAWFHNKLAIFRTVATIEITL